MSYDHGPLDTYEIVWATGHVETIDAHQVLMPQRDIFGMDRETPRWMFHGEVDGRWRLLLTAADDQIVSVRNVSQTRDRAFPGGES